MWSDGADNSRRWLLGGGAQPARDRRDPLGLGWVEPLLGAGSRNLRTKRHDAETNGLIPSAQPKEPEEMGRAVAYPAFYKPHIMWGFASPPRWICSGDVLMKITLISVKSALEAEARREVAERNEMEILVVDTREVSLRQPTDVPIGERQRQLADLRRTGRDAVGTSHNIRVPLPFDTGGSRDRWALTGRSAWRWPSPPLGRIPPITQAARNRY